MPVGDRGQSPDAAVRTGDYPGGGRPDGERLREPGTVRRADERIGAALHPAVPADFSLLLALSYAWQRKRFLYDHLITGPHFKTYVHVLLTLLIAVSAAVPPAAPYAAGGAFAAIFVYLLQMLRVTYDTGYVMAFFRTGFLQTAALIVLSLLAIGLVVLSFLLT